VQSPTGRSLSMNLMANLLAETLGRGSLFAVGILLARRVGVEGFGTLGAAQGITMLLALPVDLGLSVYGTREVAATSDEARRHSVGVAILKAKLCLSLLVLTLFAGSLAAFGKNADTAIYLAASLYLPVAAANLDWYARGIEAFLWLVLAALVTGSVLVVGATVLVQGPEDLTVAALLRPVGAACGAAVLGVALLYRVRLRGRAFGRAIVHARLASTIGLSNALLAALLYMATPITRWVAGAEAAGYYEAAARIYVLISAGAMIVQSVVFPRFVALHKRADRSAFNALHQQYQRGMCIAAVAVLGAGLFLREHIVGMLYPDSYQAAATVVGLLLLNAALDLLRYTYGSLLLACGFGRQHLRSSLASVSVAVIAMPVMSITFGARGTATALLIANTLNLCLLARAYGRHISPNHLLSIRRSQPAFGSD
jgi:O-antigen/teichoic acid export membrane protein